MKNKWLIIILCILLAAGVALGVIFIVKANKKTSVGANNTTSSIYLLQDQYTVGDKIVFQFVTFSDVQFKSVTYVLNNESEVSISGLKTGESKDHSNYRAGVGKYYADTTAQIVDTSSMTPGYYTMILYGYDASNVRYELNKTPFVFKIVAAQASPVA